MGDAWFRKGRIVIVLVLICAGVSATTWWLTWMAARSAATKAVGAAPPSAPVVAAVTAGPLVTTRTLAGTISLGKSVPLPVGPMNAEIPIVTALSVKHGDVMKSGDCPLAVAGRPLAVLTLPFPLYRTLTPGISGPDVDGVHKALIDLGRLDPPASAQLTDAAIAAFDKICGRSADGQIAPSDVIALPAGQAQVSAVGTAVGDRWAEGGISIRIGLPVVHAETNETAVLASLDSATFGDGPLTGQRALPVSATRSKSGEGKSTEVSFAIPQEAIGGLAEGTRQAVSVVTAKTGDDVLVVPAAALWTSSTGATHVRVATAQGDGFKDVAVSVLAAHGGSVALQGTEGVGVGDMVLVGHQQ